MHAPPDPGSFHPLVWSIVRQIPAGVVSTYGHIASMLPVPAGVSPQDYARLGPVWVGKAMQALSSQDEPTIPWQRVINSQGGISLPAGSRLALEQQRRLQHEGIHFTRAGRVPLQVYGWDGPEVAWLQAHGLRQPEPLRQSTPTTQEQLPLL